MKYAEAPTATRPTATPTNNRPSDVCKKSILGYKNWFLNQKKKKKFNLARILRMLNRVALNLGKMKLISLFKMIDDKIFKCKILVYFFLKDTKPD